MSPHLQTETQADRSAETRSRILDAALTEFSREGLAGARTEPIAAAAGVNKALLYYYFESKEKLYAAALEMVSARVRDRSMAVFLREASPGERVLRAALEPLRPHPDAARVSEPDAAGDDSAAQGRGGRAADSGQARLRAAACHVSVDGARRHCVGRAD